MNNPSIECLDCGHKFTPPVLLVFPGNDLRDKFKNKLKCSCTSTNLKTIPQPGFPNLKTNISLSPADRKAMLKKRSKDHFNRKIKEEKTFIDQQFQKNVNERFGIE